MSQDLRASCTGPFKAYAGCPYARLLRLVLVSLMVLTLGGEEPRPCNRASTNASRSWTPMSMCHSMRAD